MGHLSLVHRSQQQLPFGLVVWVKSASLLLAHTQVQFKCPPGLVSDRVYDCLTLWLARRWAIHLPKGHNGQALGAVRRREVDAVAVWKLDRLGRSLEHLLQLLREFEANQVRLLVHDMAIDTGTPQGRLFFQMAGTFPEFEQPLQREMRHLPCSYALHSTR